MAFRHRLFNKQGAAERIGGIARVPLSFRSSFFARLIKNGTSNEPSRSFFSFFFRLIVVNELYQETWEKRLASRFLVYRKRDESRRERETIVSPSTKKVRRIAIFYLYLSKTGGFGSRERKKKKEKSRVFNASKAIRRAITVIRAFVNEPRLVRLPSLLPCLSHLRLNRVLV